nr:MAG TPA: hypothetical protein [Caudoviricetes sp.]
MKKVLSDMIIKWHERGYKVDGIAPLVPKSHAWKSKCSSDNTKRTAMLETMIAVCLIALAVLISYLGR